MLGARPERWNDCLLYVSVCIFTIFGIALVVSYSQCTHECSVTLVVIGIILLMISCIGSVYFCLRRSHL